MSCIYIDKQEFQVFYQNILAFKNSHDFGGGLMYKYDNKDIYNNVKKLQQSHYEYMQRRYGDKPDQSITEITDKELYSNKWADLIYFRYTRNNLFKFYQVLSYVDYQCEDTPKETQEFLKDLQCDITSYFMLKYKKEMHDNAADLWAVKPIYKNNDDEINIFSLI